MLVIGANGLAKQLLPTLALRKEEVIVFVDELNIHQSELAGYTVIHTREDIISHLQLDSRFIIGVGKPSVRKSLTGRFTDLGGNPIGIIHPSVMLSNIRTSLHATMTALQGVVIESFVTVGEGVLINVNATICHDSIIGSFTEIGPNVTITGSCRIGANCTIGAGAIFVPGIEIGDNVIIGAGSVVTRNIDSNSKAYGVPARKIV